MPLHTENRSAADAHRDTVLEKIVASLKGLQFGSVNVVVQDGTVVQIERIEKHRLHQPRRLGDAVGR